jgi:hypothetical protein
LFFFVVETLDKEIIEIEVDARLIASVKDLKKAYRYYDDSIFILEYREDLNKWE